MFIVMNINLLGGFKCLVIKQIIHLKRTELNLKPYLHNPKIHVFKLPKQLNEACEQTNLGYFYYFP